MSLKILKPRLIWEIMIKKFILFLAFCFIASKYALAQNSTVLISPTPPSKKIVKILFLGNSLTLHSPNEKIGWHGNWGMAASAERYDYVHHLLNFINIPTDDAYIRNTYLIEVDSKEYRNIIRSIKNDVKLDKNPIVIIQVGDNVPSNEDSVKYFEKSLGNILLYFNKKNSNIFCVSTWWVSQPKDALISRVCKRHGGEFIFIGDISGNPSNSDRSHMTYSHAGVDAHPKNWGMSEIASRIRDAIHCSVPKG